MSDNTASSAGIALAALPAARSNLPRTPEATSPAPSAPRTPPTHAGNTTQPQPQPQPTTARGRAWRKVLELTGYAGQTSAQRDRWLLVRYLTVVVLSVSQIIVIMVLTAVAGVRVSPFPQHPGQTELGACTILAAWNLIWMGRLVLKLYLESWLYIKRKRMEARRSTLPRELPATPGEHDPRGEPALTRMPSSSDAICPLSLQACHVLLLKLDPFIAIVWFFSAILVIYAHGSRCRVAAQAISAATYTILIVVYSHFVLTIIIPMIYTLMARRQVGRPTIQKLSRAEVDRIPLVLYIPPPPGDAPTSPITPLPQALSSPPLLPRPAPTTSTRRRRFVFFRPQLKRRKTDNADLERGIEDLSANPAHDVDEWDQMFGPAMYPFVRLPENRATCGICLAEFEAPRRLNGRDKDGDGDEPPTGNSNDEAHELADVPRLDQGSDGTQITEVRVESPRPMDAGALQLADSDNSEAPEPLRLLGCGHVYHKDCIDQWLTQKSGRCPYCQARVEVPPPARGRRGTWRRGTV
ncbi:hypothetical protein OH76DRAFT_800821 [Lentinus brumalis]|uniref:RING-type domain-containing protein n=1 Tax=Lentinus brumalis TaxID=2498619 RepID=A0A371D397_9APHY|nr:hypothetical protein OH76DRAFT_800821 [Polyporus brumalis]